MYRSINSFVSFVLGLWS